MQEAPEPFWASLGSVPSQPRHSEWPTMGAAAPLDIGLAEQAKRQDPLAQSHYNISATSWTSSPASVLPHCFATPMSEKTTSYAPGKNILALVTATADSKPPVLEFRLKAEDESEDLTACHRVRAYVYNQTVSSHDNLFKGSGMCGGCAHLFDLEVLNLAYHGSSAWSVAKVGQFPSGAVSMVLLDTHGNSARFNVGVQSWATASPPPMGTLVANVSKAMSGGISLHWQEKLPEIAATPTFTVSELLTQLQEPPTKPEAPRKTAMPVRMEIGKQAQSAPKAPSVSYYLELAPAKPRKDHGKSKPRTRVSKRIVATLHFFADRDNLTRSKWPKALPTAGDGRDLASSWPGAMRSSKKVAMRQADTFQDALARYSPTHEGQLESCADEAVLDLFAPLMNSDEHAADAFDLADCLANDIMNTPELVYAK